MLKVGGAMAVVVALGVLVAVGVGVFVVGWRGRRVGGHRYCRGCGFDLYGRGEGPGVCPECGRDLERAGAWVVGERRRRRAWVAVGVVMAVSGAAGLSVIGWGRAKGVNWYAWAPTWWLVRAAEGKDVMVRDAAMGELIGRIQKGKVSEGTASRLVEDGLRVQGNVATAWVVGWGDLIEAGRAKGMVSDGEWERYGRQAVSVGWMTGRARAKLEVGGPMALRLDCGPARVGSGGKLEASGTPREVWVDGEERLGGKSAHWRMTAMLGWRIHGVFAVRIGESPMVGEWAGTMGVLAGVDIGKHEGVVVMGLTVSERPAVPTTMRSFAPGVIAPARAEGPKVAEVAVRLPVSFEVVSAGEGVERVTDEQVGARVRAALSKARLTRLGSRWRVEGDFRGVGVAMYFRVFARQGGREWPVGVVVWEAGRRGMVTEMREGMALVRGWGARDWNGPGMGEEVELVFRPDAGLARGSDQVDVQAYWGEEEVVKGVRVGDVGESLRRGATTRRRATG